MLFTLPMQIRSIAFVTDMHVMYFLLMEGSHRSKLLGCYIQIMEFHLKSPIFSSIDDLFRHGEIGLIM
jgi:hypothetical protein